MLATFQVIVCGVPPVQEVAVLGCVTAKGPAVDTTLIWRPAFAEPPPEALLSRAVKRKFIVRVVEGSTWPVKQVELPQA